MALFFTEAWIQRFKDEWNNEKEIFEVLTSSQAFKVLTDAVCSPYRVLASTLLSHTAFLVKQHLVRSLSSLKGRLLRPGSSLLEAQ